MLDVGAENTSMIVMQGPRFWVRNLMTGGRRVTDTLQQRFGVPFEQAEEAKLSIARSDLASDLVEAVKPPLHGMVSELKTNLRYCRRSGIETEFDAVFAVGAGARLLGMKAQMRQSLGHEISDIRSVEKVFVAPEANVQLVRSNLDRLAVAIGTGVKALGKIPIDVSFVPETVARQTRASGTKRFMLATGRNGVGYHAHGVLPVRELHPAS